MVAALATAHENRVGTHRRRGQVTAPNLASFETTTVEIVDVETLPGDDASYDPVLFESDPTLDGGMVAAMGEMLRVQREEASASISASLAARGVDSTVCAFLEDDMREAADALADAEAFFQETIEALMAPRPSPKVLMERAADAGVLERVDHLHQVLSNMRRRLVQVAAGIRHAERPRR